MPKDWPLGDLRTKPARRHVDFVAPLSHPLGKLGSPLLQAAPTRIELLDHQTDPHVQPPCRYCSDSWPITSRPSVARMGPYAARRIGSPKSRLTSRYTMSTVNSRMQR